MSTTTGEDPKVLANYRFARGAVIILSILIVIALIALLLGFTVRTGGKSRIAPVADNSGASRLTLPIGSHIVSLDVQQNRLIVRTRAFEGEEIDIIDTQDGRLVGRISVPLESGEKAPK